MMMRGGIVSYHVAFELQADSAHTSNNGERVHFGVDTPITRMYSTVYVVLMHWVPTAVRFEAGRTTSTAALAKVIKRVEGEKRWADRETSAACLRRNRPCSRARSQVFPVWL